MAEYRGTAREIMDLIYDIAGTDSCTVSIVEHHFDFKESCNWPKWKRIILRWLGEREYVTPNVEIIIITFRYFDFNLKKKICDTLEEFRAIGLEYQVRFLGSDSVTMEGRGRRINEE